jgi:hypothetical protein
VPRRVVIAKLAEISWAPPGCAPGIWRRALAEDVVDLLAALTAANAAIAVKRGDADLADAVAWPRMPTYEIEPATVRAALDAAAADGYDEAAVLAGDAPDVPGLLVGKLLQPLGTRHAAVAPATNGGLLGVAVRLPVPEWFPDLDLDAAAPDDLRDAAPRRAIVAVTPGWHRLRGPADLARLDPALDGWETTRALLTSRR